jgi:hypothetical protein
MIMAAERKTKSDQHDHENNLPKDVLNNAQEPDSFRDPLEVQLSKSRDMNSEEQNQKLEDVKKKNRGEE